MTPEIEHNIQRARGQGDPLPRGVQQQMEGAMDADFSKVRVHTNNDANQLSRSLEARAFTAGRDIFFKEGAYDPVGSSGQRSMKVCCAAWLTWSSW